MHGKGAGQLQEYGGAVHILRPLWLMRACVVWGAPDLCGHHDINMIMSFSQCSVWSC